MDTNERRDLDCGLGQHRLESAWKNAMARQMVYSRKVHIDKNNKEHEERLILTPNILKR